MDPASPHIGGPIIEHNINLPGLQLLPQGLPTTFCCDVLLESHHTGERLDWNQVHSYNKAGYRHKLGSYLQPSPWRSTQVQQGSGFLQELKAAIELDQLESRSGTVTRLLRQVIKFVPSALANFALLAHGGMGEYCSIWGESRS